MKTINKPVHYCEHCNKYYLSKYFAEKHEKICFKNPENKRACFGCEFLDKQVTKGYFDAFDGQHETKYTVLVCMKFNCGVYPPKFEINQNFIDMLDIENEAMPKECDKINNPFL